MRIDSRVLCLWPGLAQLWLKGHVPSMVTAAAFGGALNLVLVSTFVWPEWFPALWLWCGWGLVATAWGAGVFWAFRYLAGTVGHVPADERGLFIRAQSEYLKGHWGEAERLLQRRLAECSEDVEGRLLLATLYRRRRRWADAQQHLDQLQRMEAAEKWRWEIEQERAFLERERKADGADQRRKTA